ncbi:hypothetical protein RJ55_06231 [Drechmeria coniospora]|nr:hypothetical protein RJ55_06231 [Drechmeria coniospora]
MEAGPKRRPRQYWPIVDRGGVLAIGNSNIASELPGPVSRNLHRSGSYCGRTGPVRQRHLRRHVSAPASCNRRKIYGCGIGRRPPSSVLVTVGEGCDVQYPVATTYLGERPAASTYIDGDGKPTTRGESLAQHLQSQQCVHARSRIDLAKADDTLTYTVHIFDERCLPVTGESFILLESGVMGSQRPYVRRSRPRRLCSCLNPSVALPAQLLNI